MRFRGFAISAAIGWLLLGCSEPVAAPSPWTAPRHATAAAIVGGRIYIAGGIAQDSAGRATATMESYDTYSGAWTACAPMPTPRAHAGAVAARGSIYVFGGVDDAGQTLATVDVFDAGRNSWSSIEPMPVPRSGHTAVNRSGLVVVCGGQDATGQELASVNTYSMRSAGPQWLHFPDLPAPRVGAAVTGANDRTERLFLVGGCEAGQAVSTVYEFTTDGHRYLWKEAPSLAEARAFHGLAVIDRRAYAVGGDGASIPRTEILDLDATQNGWTQAAPLPRRLWSFAMVSARGRLLVFGGVTDESGTVNRDVFTYDPGTDTWSSSGSK